jgi:hypothetical protein
MSVVNGPINHGITLGTPGYFSPLTVTSTGSISNAGVGSAIYGTTGTVVNQGTLTASGASIFGKYSGIEIYGSGSAYNSGTINAESNGIAIYGTGTVTNTGSVSGQQWGVDGRSGYLDVTNTGTIYGADDGIVLFSGGSVTNSLTIIGANGIAITGDAGTVDNIGSIVGTYQTGIALSAGGSVTNGTGGVVSGGGPYTGIYISGGAGTITNGGTIDGYVGVGFGGTYNDTLIDSGTIIGRGGIAVTFSGGNDLLQLLPGSLSIEGLVDGGAGINTLELASAASIGTLTGVDAAFVNFSQATVDVGARWVLAGSNTLGTGTTLTNSGTLTDAGTLTNAGIFYGALTLAAGATLTNAATGTISASGIAVFGAAGGAATVVNAGSIGGNPTSEIGVYLSAGGSVTNQSGGTITGATAIHAKIAASIVNQGAISGVASNGIGVALMSGGSVTNQSGGTITGGDFAVNIHGAGTVVNTGSIGGAGTGYGIALAAGGSVTNMSGGVITGRQAIEGLATTVVNAGSIGGGATAQAGVYLLSGGSITNQSGGTIQGSGDAVKFQAGSAASVVIDPGAVFSGKVDGGNTIGATATSTLELAGGGTAGTLSGLGAQYTHFSQVSVDAGSDWTLSGANTLVAGATLTDSGMLTDAGTLINDGTVIGGFGGFGGGGGRNGIAVAGGSLSNQGTIAGGVGGASTSFGSGGGGGIGVVLSSGSLTNQATITGGFGGGGDGTDGGGGGAGVDVTGGSLASTTQGMITGGIGGYGTGYGGGGGAGVALTSGSLTNQGTIKGGAGGYGRNYGGGGGAGIGVEGGGLVITNQGTIIGGTGGGSDGGAGGGAAGVRFQLGGTLVDAGSVSGGIGMSGIADAVYFGGATNNRLIVENGYGLSGGVFGSASASNTLELLGTAGDAVSVSYNSLGLTNFSTVAFAPGDATYATLRVTSNTALPGTLAGFIGVHDTVDLTALSDAGNDATTSFNTLTNVLTVTGDNGSVGLQLDGENYTGVRWEASNDGANGTDVTVLCFCAGTGIATPTGDVRVERLSVGDLVLTLDGRALPIKWIGTGQSLLPRGGRTGATPVIVRAGALDDAVPRRDLRLTKGHSLYLETVLIPVENLINHRSILWDDEAHSVVVYHIELATHEVLLAEGAPAESYRDDGNRVQFQNVNPEWDIAPVAEPFAPIVTNGPVVAALWQRLLRRATPCAPIEMTGDPDLHLLVDGARVTPSMARDGIHAFEIMAGAADVRIGSRSAIPAELGLNHDQRRLGVAIRRIVLHQRGLTLEIDAASPAWEVGFRRYEAAGGFRWTDGAGLIPPRLLQMFAADQPVSVEIHVACATCYRVPTQPRSDMGLARVA